MRKLAYWIMIFALLSASLAACGAAPEPTMAPAGNNAPTLSDSNDFDDDIPF